MPTVLCPDCSGGLVERERIPSTTSVNGYTSIMICPKCHPERAPGFGEQQETLRRADLVRRAKAHAGIHGPLQDWSFDTYEISGEGQFFALNAAREFFQHWRGGQSPGWLAFLGKNGTGKCHLAVSIANAMIETAPGTAVIYTKLIRLMRRIRATYGNVSRETEQQVVKEIDRAELLILDEFGIRTELSDWERATLDDIIDHRWERGKPLIITSNMNAKDLFALAGERIESRFAELGQVVKFTWDDWRKASRRKG